jgi:hypothetical protein
MLELARAHPRAVTGIYTYIGAGQSDSGAFDFGHSAATSNNMTWIRAKVRAFNELGLTVTPALSLTNASIMSGNALKEVAKVAAFAKAANVSGLMLDFEPATSEVKWVKAYAQYVAGFTKAMHAAGLRAEMCVSDWGILDGHFLKNGEGYGVYAKTGVDTMMSMAGTYYGTNISRNMWNVDLEIKQGVSLSQLAVGVGSVVSPSCPGAVPGTVPNRYNWTDAKLQQFVSFISRKGVTQLDIWRVDIGAETDCTEPWIIEIAEKFTAGAIGGSASLKTDDAPTDTATSVWACNAVERIFPDSRPPIFRKKVAAVSLAAGEIESLQIAVRTGAKASSISVTVDAATWPSDDDLSSCIV